MTKKLSKSLCSSLFTLMIGIFLWPKIAFCLSLSNTEIIQLTNIERNNHELLNLQENKLLTDAAKNKAADILKTQKFQHNIDDKKFSQWIKDTNYTYSYVGENLAIDFFDAADVIDAWMKSELHKKNLLNRDFRDIGVAAIEGEFEGRKTIVVVQLFGTEQEAEASADEYAATKNSFLGETKSRSPLTGDSGLTKDSGIGDNYNFIAIGFMFVLLGELWVVLPRRKFLNTRRNSLKLASRN